MLRAGLPEQRVSPPGPRPPSPCHRHRRGALLPTDPLYPRDSGDIPARSASIPGSRPLLGGRRHLRCSGPGWKLAPRTSPAPPSACAEGAEETGGEASKSGGVGEEAPEIRGPAEAEVGGPGCPFPPPSFLGAASPRQGLLAPHPSCRAGAPSTAGGERSLRSTSSNLPLAKFSAWAAGQGIMGGAWRAGPAPSPPPHAGVPPSVSSCSLLLCRARISQASRCSSTCEERGGLSVCLYSWSLLPSHLSESPYLNSFIHSFIQPFINSVCSFCCG